MAFKKKIVIHKSTIALCLRLCLFFRTFYRKYAYSCYAYKKKLVYVPLWCDEGVYRIAKELQLLNPSKFANIFLGLGGFHFQKVLIGCCGAYLSETGIQSALVQNEVFGPGNVKSVMSRGNYIRGKRGMMLIAEALLQLQIEAFVSSSNFDQSRVEDLQLFQKMVEKEEN